MKTGKNFQRPVFFPKIGFDIHHNMNIKGSYMSNNCRNARIYQKRLLYLQQFNRQFISYPVSYQETESYILSKGIHIRFIFVFHFTMYYYVVCTVEPWIIQHGYINMGNFLRSVA